MKIGKGTIFSKAYILWPQQVSIGEKCKLEYNIYFKFNGIWQPGPSIIIGDRVFIGNGCEFNIHKGIRIGNDSLIASGCKFIDHDHGIVLNGQPIRSQLVYPSEQDLITIGNNVWLGYNVVVLKGVTIAEGAVVAAGAVVTKSIGANEIWAGVPAKKIGDRKP
jgi:Acetyltransferase (isoleucine patch superfamily)